MTHEIDAELERLRGLVADHTALFNRFGVIGRELALAEQDVRDAEAVTNSNQHEAGKRKWQRGSTNISALNNTAKDLIELRQRADVLRCDRERVSAEYQSFGRPAEEYAALLERKIELLASSPDHAGEEVRGLQASKQSYIDYSERVNAALSAGNDAARELVAMTTILRLERGNAVSSFVVFGGVIGAVAIAADVHEMMVIAGRAAELLIVFNEQLAAIPAPPLHTFDYAIWQQLGLGVQGHGQVVLGELNQAIGWYNARLTEANNTRASIERSLRQVAETVPWVVDA